MKKRDNGKFIFISVSVVLVMLAGLYINSLGDDMVKHAEGASSYSVEILPLEEEKEDDEELMLSQEEGVFITTSGSRFHIKDDCGSMNPENAQKITVKEAIEKELSPCKICLKNAKIN